MSLTVSLEWRHNVVGLDGPWRTPSGELVPVLRLRRPNACEAEALFRSDWTERQVVSPVTGRLALTVEFDHGHDGTTSIRLTPCTEGWAARLRLHRGRLMCGAFERPIEAIHMTLETAMRELINRVGRTRLHLPGD